MQMDMLSLARLSMACTRLHQTIEDTAFLQRFASEQGLVQGNDDFVLSGTTIDSSEVLAVLAEVSKLGSNYIVFQLASLSMLRR